MDEDLSARIHTASQDPAFPVRREAGFRAIVAAIDTALSPLGYTLKGSTWSRSSAAGKSAVHLQRSRYGWDAHLALRFLAPDGTLPTDWPGDDDVRLSHFTGGGDDDPGTLAYLDTEDHPDRLSDAVAILTSQAMPWLDAHHGTPPAPRHHPVDLVAALSRFSDHWSPKIVAGFNGHDVMVVKAKGEFVWHSHPDTDDFFLVLHGQLTIRLRDGEVTLNPGDLYVVPKGVEHCPMATEEVHILLIEPTGTPNTGDPATAALKSIL